MGRGQQTSRRIRDGRCGVELAADGGGPGTSQPAWAPSLATRDRGWNGRKTPGDAQPTPSATLATRATLATAPPRSLRCPSKPSLSATYWAPPRPASDPPRPAQPLTSLPSFWPAPSHFPTLCLFFLLPSPSLRAPPFSANPTPSLPSFWLPPQNLSPPSLCSSKTTTSHLLSSSSLLPLPSHQLHKRTSQRLNIASKPSSSSPAPSGTDTQTRRGHPEPLT